MKYLIYILLSLLIISVGLLAYENYQKKMLIEELEDATFNLEFQKNNIQKLELDKKTKKTDTLIRVIKKFDTLYLNKIKIQHDTIFKNISRLPAIQQYNFSTKFFDSLY